MPETIDQALSKARNAFAVWRDCSFSERARVMREAGAYLRQHESRLVAKSKNSIVFSSSATRIASPRVGPIRFTQISADVRRTFVNELAVRCIVTIPIWGVPDAGRQRGFDARLKSSAV